MNDTMTMAHRHRCPGPGPRGGGCTSQVAGDKLMCGYCWRLVPKPLQRRVWAAYREGDGIGTPEHADAMRAAIEAVNGDA